MNCPKCGKEMEKGEIADSRGDTACYWAPDAFFKKHWLNPYCHLRKTVTSGGGLLIRMNSRLGAVSAAYGCVSCGIVVAECET